MMIRLLLSASGGNCMMSTRKIVNCSFQFEEHMTSETSLTFQKQLKGPDNSLPWRPPSVLSDTKTNLQADIIAVLS